MHFVVPIQVMRLKLLPLLCAAFLIAALAASAHHSIAGYETDRLVEATGVVKEWDWG